MSREWQPGDLAMVPGIGICMLSDRRNWLSCRHDAGRVPADGYFGKRPLVVIDPEDRTQVKRLYDLFNAEYISREGGDLRDGLAAALREFANPTPPKPDEPKGLGAVVRVRDGDLYVSAAVPGLSSCRWVRVDETSEGKPWCYHNFNFLDVVEVLSEEVAS